MIEKQESLCKTGSKEDKARLEVLKKIKQVLEDGKPASVLDLSNEEKKAVYKASSKKLRQSMKVRFDQPTTAAIMKAVLELQKKNQ